jgi:hypothetical protein
MWVWGGGEVVGSQRMSTAVHMEPTYTLEIQLHITLCLYPKYATFPTLLLSHYRLSLKGQCHEIFCLPKPLSIPLGPFRIFWKIAEIFIAQLPPVSTTPPANFATSFTSVVDTGGKFATGVNDTGGKFAAGVNGTGGKLPPVSTTLVANNGNNIRLQIT